MFSPNCSVLFYIYVQNHFGLIFIGYKIWIKGYFFACGYLIVLAPFLKKPTFSPLNYLCIFAKFNRLYTRGPISGLAFLPLCLSFLQYHPALTTMASGKSGSQVVSVLQHCSFSKLCWLFQFLPFHVDFKIGL